MVLKITSFRHAHSHVTLHGNLRTHISVEESWLEIDGATGWENIPIILTQTSQNTAFEYSMLSYGQSHSAASATTCNITLVFNDGTRRSRPITLPDAFTQPEKVHLLDARQWSHFLKVGLIHISRGESKLLLAKVQRLLKRLLTREKTPAAFFKWAVSAKKPLVLIIDHDLGGGANLYRNQLMRAMINEDKLPLLLTANLSLPAYRMHAQQGRQMTHFDTLKTLQAILSTVSIEAIYINNLVSYPEPLSLADILCGLVNSGRSERLVFLLHDYYPVCPSWTLLDHTGHYCGVPVTSACSACLPHQRTRFLHFSAGQDIPSWRAAWQPLLECANEIRCFSDAARDIFLRAFPQLLPDKTTVVPHTIEHLSARPVTLHDPGHPMIGIIGHITSPKGSEVVSALSAYIAATGHPARVVVIGTIEATLDPTITTVTGPYQPDQLPTLLEEHQVNVGFFPSVWPETFSYVTAEMMALELPVICFDLGAPEERVSSYARGQVIACDHPQTILDAADRLYSDYVSHRKTAQY